MGPRRCPECGVEAPVGASFCGSCGAALVDASATPGPAPSPVAPLGVFARHTTLDAAPPSAPDGPATSDRPSAPPSSASATSPGPSATGRRRSVVGAVVVGALVALAVVVSGPSVDAIVVGDGLTVASGPGPAAQPERRWSSATTLTEPLPPVVAAETIVVAGRQGDDAAVVGIDRSTGRQLWSTTPGPGRPVSLHAVDGTVTLVTTGGSDTTTRLTRVEARTGDAVWPVDVEVEGVSTSTVALPDGATLVSVLAEAGAPRTLLVSGDGRIVTDASGGPAAASSEVVAVLDGPTVRTLETGGASLVAVDVVGAPVTGLAVAGRLVVVGQDQLVRAFDVDDGEERWSVDTGATVAAITASPWASAVVTTAGSLGLDDRGRILWEGGGIPLPLVRDDEGVTLLLTPGSTVATELRLVGASGEDELTAAVPRGQYLALGRDVVLAAVGDDVVATPLEDGEEWSVTTPGPVEWLVLDGPTMVVLSRDGRRTTVTLWS